MAGIKLIIRKRPNTGHWIYRGQDTYECSECGKNHYGNYGTPCCENCGAKMVEPQGRSSFLKAEQAAKDYYLHLSEKYGDMEEMSIEKEN